MKLTRPGPLDGRVMIMMISASQARMLTATNLDNLASKAKNEIRDNPSHGWVWLMDIMEGSIRYEVKLNKEILINRFGDNNYWDKHKLYRTLVNLGFQVKESIDDNPNTDSWTIVWG